MKNNIDLSRFKKVKSIGEGSYGEVYKIKETATGKVYAAKISKNTIKEKSKDERLNLKREVNALSQLNHPSVLKFIGFSQTDFEGESKPVIITDFLSHGSLDDLINKSRDPESDVKLSETNKLIILYGIASAMAYIHSNGFIHRDLKPGNILLDDSLYPIIADLGLAKIMHKDEDIEQTQQSMQCIPKGTPLYLAPEIIQFLLDGEDIIYTKAVDVYSFSIIIYQLFSSEPPFKNLSQYKLFTNVSSGDRPTLTAEIPTNYQKLIKKCWSQDPTKRPTFSQIVEILKSDEFTKGKIQRDKFNEYIQYIQSTSLIYPSDKFSHLSSSCQKIVRNAESNHDLQFQVGKNLIEGINGFPRDITVGAAYLNHSAKGGNVKGTEYYCRLLIEGELIDEDIGKAKKYLKKLLKTVDDKEKPFVFLLYGMAMIKKPNYAVAVHALTSLFALDSSRFNKEQKLALGEGFFEYAKILYEGKGKEMQVEKAMEYFAKAESCGFKKQVNDYLEKMQNEEETENESKKVDLIFLVDGTYGMQYFVESLKENIIDASQEWKEKYPDFDFMFGAVIYRDTAVTRLFGGEKNIDKVNCCDLTDDIDDVYGFLNKTKFEGGGYDGPEDWASGFSSLLNKISWRDESVKIVIHICDSPGHGKYFTCKKGFYKRTIKIPSFNETNTNEENLAIYNREVQTKPYKYIYKLICLLAKKNIMFFCMNGKDKAMQCFKATRDIYIQKGGPKYIVMNQFNCIYYKQRKGKFDSSDLNKNMKELLINSVDISIDTTYNEDNEPSEFELECMKQFDENLQEYEKNAYSNMSGMQSDESVASFSSVGSNLSRSSTMNAFDLGSDMDDSVDESDSEDGEIEVVVRRKNLAKKSKDDDSDDDDDNDGDDHDEDNKIKYSRRPTIARGENNNNNRRRPNRWHQRRGRGGRFNNRGNNRRGQNSSNNRNTRKDDDFDIDAESNEEQNIQNNYNRNNRSRGGGNRNTRKDADDEQNNEEESVGNSSTRKNFNKNRRGGYNDYNRRNNPRNQEMQTDNDNQSRNYNNRRNNTSRGGGQRRAQNRGTD